MDETQFCPPQVYGSLAGRPILPGCVPLACKATYSAFVQQGTIHIQVRLMDGGGGGLLGACVR